MLFIGVLPLATQQTNSFSCQAETPAKRCLSPSKGIFQKTEERVKSAWRAVCIGFKATQSQVSFLFFRALQWIHPWVGAQAENLFLRVSLIWGSIQEAWRKEEVEKEMESLRNQNRLLSLENAQLKATFSSSERIRQESLEQSAFASKMLENATNQKQSGSEREQAVVAFRKIEMEKNQKLEEENATLVQELEGVKKELEGSKSSFLLLQNQLAKAQKEVGDLNLQIPSQEKMNVSLAAIAKASQQIHRYGEHTELDDGLNHLLPLMRSQIEQAQNMLAQAKGNVNERSAAAIALQSFERIMNQVTDYLDQIPQAFQMHSQWQQLSTSTFYLQTQPLQEV